MASIILTETIGTMMLILLGDGVVAGVLLNKSKSQSSGWIVITTAWAFAVFVGVFTSVALGGSAHLNPAVTVGLALNGAITWGDSIYYFIGEFLGAMIGALLVFLHYYPHWKETTDAGLKLAVFCTAPAIRSSVWNLVSEIIGTFALVFGVFLIVGPEMGLGALSALPVALLVWVIGLALGGTTGYAINPARDLGPRIMHAILPIPGKGGSDWGYSWVPVIGPVLGAVLAWLVFTAVK